MKTAIFYYKSGDHLLVKNASNNAIIQIPLQAINEVEASPDASRFLNEILKKKGFWDCFECLNKDSLQIMLSVSNRCNLCCSYCFEKEKNGTILTREHSNSVLKFIEDRIIETPVGEVDITFTGGEPFINSSEIEYIVDCLNSVYGAAHTLKFSYITNGTIVNQDIIRLLQSTSGEVQVTLDGFRQSHDKYRTGKLKLSTFDIICDNINRILNETDCNVVIRINTVVKNKSEYFLLLNFLYDRWGLYYRSGRISHYFAFLDVEMEKKDLDFSNDEKLDLLYHVMQKEIELGLPIKQEYVSGAQCMIRNSNGYTIDSDGVVYDCFSFVGDIKFSIGHIGDMRFLREHIQEYTCTKSNCSFYTKCYGGCIYSNYVKTGKKEPLCEKEYFINVNKILFAMSLYQMKLTYLMSFDEVMDNVFFDEVDI